MQIGLAFPPTGLPIDVYFEIVQQAEMRGFSNIWTGEAWGTESCTLVGALLARSRYIHIGTSIVSIHLRPPTLTAMQAATLDTIAPGRARLGLGVSTRNINEFHGLGWDYPVSRMREYVAILRQALAGERVTYDGQFYQPKGFRLSLSTSGPMPLYLAAVNPKMLQLAGEVADGVLLAWLPARQLPHSIAEIAKGAKRAGRSLADIEIGAYLHTVVTQNRERAMGNLRRVLVGYSQANTYIQGFRHFGYGDVLDDIHSRLQAGDRAGAEAAIPESMLEELYIFGTPEECHDQLHRFIKAGVQHPILAAPASSRVTVDDMYALVKTFSQ